MQYKAGMSHGRLMSLVASMTFMVIGCGDEPQTNKEAVKRSYTAAELQQAAPVEHQKVAGLMQQYNISRLEWLVADGDETTTRLVDRDGNELGRGEGAFVKSKIALSEDIGYR